MPTRMADSRMAERLRFGRSAVAAFGSSAVTPGASESAGSVAESVPSAPRASGSSLAPVTRSAEPGRCGTPRRARRGGHRRATSALLLDLRLLTAQLAQVVQLGAAHIAAGGDVDVVDVRRVDGERPLDANAVAFLADGEGLTDAPALPANDDTLEDLDAFLGTLDHLDMHINGVAGAEGRDVVAQRRLVDEVQRVHR